MKALNPIKNTDIMPTSFLYLKVIGAWKPLGSPKWLITIYDLGSITMLIFICKMMIISQILCIVFAEENRLKVFKDNVHIITTHVSGWIKMLNIINRQQSITLLVNNCIAKQWNPPRDRSEFLILTRYSNLARRTTLAYSALVFACSSTIVLNPILSSKWMLPVDAWYPCNISSPICYWSCYVHQSIGFVTIAVVHVATDSLIAGFTIQICTQLNILNQRLMSIQVKQKEYTSSGRCLQRNQEEILALESLLVNECVMNYSDIKKQVYESFAQLLSKTFIEVVFIQFCVGLSVICTTVYLLAKLSIFHVAFLGLLLYLGCMLSQMFLFCWYGNEVVINSTKVFHTIYDMNWLELQIKTQKKLLLMMCVASSPIQLFKGAIVQVNLDAFINVLKFSYSAFNILQSSS